MSHPEHPGSNNKPSDQPKPKGAELFSLGKVKNAIMGNSLAKGLTNAVKSIYEQAEIKRERADAICGKILASGIFDSSEYKNHLKSLHLKIAPLEKKKESHEYPDWPAEHQTAITGQDGILYKIESSYNGGGYEGYYQAGSDKLTFLNDKQEEMVVTIEYEAANEGTRGSFSITRNGKEIIHEEEDTWPAHGQPYPVTESTTEEEIAAGYKNKDIENQRATACYRQTVSMPNISALHQQLGK